MARSTLERRRQLRLRQVAGYGAKALLERVLAGLGPGQVKAKRWRRGTPGAHGGRRKEVRSPIRPLTLPDCEPARPTDKVRVFLGETPQEYTMRQYTDGSLRHMPPQVGGSERFNRRWKRARTHTLNLTGGNAQ